MEHLHPPNPNLRAARLSRNWTLNDAARELRTLMTSRGETQTGVDRHHVYRWERGARRPDMRYRRYLCLLYGLRADQLGFLPEDDVLSDLAPQAGQAAPLEVNGHATQLGCSDDDLELLNLSRRRLLAASGLLGAAIGAGAAERFTEPLERAASIASGRAAADDELIGNLSAITEGLQRTTSITAATLLVPTLHAHINMVKAVLGQSMLPAQRDALLRNASHATSMMSALQFFDLRDRKMARIWLAESIEMGEASSNFSIHVLGLTRAAKQFTYSGQAAKSVQILEHARKLAERKCSPNALSGVLADQAEAYATLQQPAEVPRLLDLAADAQQRSRSGYEPSWGQHWNRNRLAGYIGATYMRLGQPGPARTALHEALAAADPSAIKIRSVYLVDLATTYAQELEIEQACDLAGKALDIAGPMNFGTTLERMAGLRRRLAHWPASRAVRNLDERLRAVGTA